MPYVLAAAFWLATVVFGVALLMVAIAAGRAAHAWARVLLLILEVLVEGAVLLGLFGEVWFLAKTVMSVGIPAAGALILAIVVGLVLIAPAVVLVRLIAANGYALVGRRARFRSDFRGSLWVSRSSNFRPREFDE